MEDQQDYLCQVQYLSATAEPVQLYPADVTLNSTPWHDAIWKEILRSPNNCSGEESSGTIVKTSSTLDRKPPLLQSFLWLLCHPHLGLWLEHTLELSTLHKPILWVHLADAHLLPGPIMTLRNLAYRKEMSLRAHCHKNKDDTKLQQHLHVFWHWNGFFLDFPTSWWVTQAIGLVQK